MKVAICYTSLSGNTEQIARGIEAVLGDQVFYFGPPAEAALDADLLFLGFWNRHSRAEEKMTAFFAQVAGKKVACFMTLGSGNPAYWERSWANVREDLPAATVLLGTYACQGKMRPSVLTKYENYRAQGKSGAEARIANYYAALTHPDAEDIEVAQKWALEIYQKAQGEKG